MSDFKLNYLKLYRVQPIRVHKMQSNIIFKVQQFGKFELFPMRLRVLIMFSELKLLYILHKWILFGYYQLNAILHKVSFNLQNMLKLKLILHIMQLKLYINKFVNLYQ